MATFARPAFAHRHNAIEQRWDTICTRCFRTVGIAKSESELVKSEKAHACQGLDLMATLHGVDHDPHPSPMSVKQSLR
jgi:hypothetical protein